MAKVKNVHGDVFEATQLKKGEGKLETKDSDGPVDAAEGTWVLKASDGSVSLCHPSVFEREYSKAGS